MRVLAAAIAAIGAPGVAANPSGAQVMQGSATLRQDGNRLTVTTSNGAIIHWDRFSIGAGDTTRFVQPDAASQVLNRVVGSSPSEILGRLESNGRVFLINPNGVAFGRGAQVDVGALVVSTLKLSNDDFAAGRMRFGGSAAENLAAGQIRNEGAIRTASGGTVYLVAPRVENSGLIHTPEGQVLLAAGHRVSIVNPRSPEVAWEIAAPESAAVNLGEIVARQIVLHGQVVRNAGTLQATTAVVGEDGRIVLRAQRKVEQTPAGRMSATGVDAQGRGRGGEIDIQAGEQVSLQGRVEATPMPTAGAQAGAGTPAPGSVPSLSGLAGRAGAESGGAASPSVASTWAGDVAEGRGQTAGEAAQAPSRPREPPAAVAAAPPAGAADSSAGQADAGMVADATMSITVFASPGIVAGVGSPRLPGATGEVAGSVPSTRRPGPSDPVPHPEPRHAIAGGVAGTGGRVKVLAREIVLGEGLVLDASGPAGGGTVLIGGELQGASAGGPNAQFVYMAPGARIAADATADGSGGRAIIWADDTAKVHGSISARGGPMGGDGGFIETSGRRFLEVTRPADASAPRGRAGEWLLDPYDVEIVAGGGANDLPGGQFEPGASQSKVNASAIEDALLGSNVTITTGSAGTDQGDISVNAPITMVATGVVRVLTLRAASTGGIALNADIKATGSDSGLSVVLDAGKDVAFGGPTGPRVFQLGNGTFDATKVGGRVMVSGSGSSPVITAAQVNFNRLRIDGGSLVVNGPTSIADFSFVGGGLGGAGDVVVTGPFSAGGGIINLSGGPNEARFTTQGASTVSWGPMDDALFRLGGNRRWVNEGALRIQGSAAIELGVAGQTTPATLENRPGGTLEITGESVAPIRVGSGFNGEAIVINQGAFKKTSANLSKILLAEGQAMGSTFRNESGGSVQIGAGTLRIDRGSADQGSYTVGSGATLVFAGGGGRSIGGLTLTGGAVEQEGSTATLTVTGAFVASGSAAIRGSGLLITKAGASLDGTLRFSADAGPPKQWETEGTLSGSGTIDMGSALLLNKAAIRPGGIGSAGTLTVKGRLAFDAGEGVLWLDVGGPNASDQLAIQGDVTLGGALKTDLIPGYTPLDGDRIRAITGSGSVAGRFSSVQMASMLIGFAPTYELGDPVRLVHAGAGVRLFTNALGGRNWDADDNWRGGQRPQGGDAVLIDASTAAPVVHGGAAGSTGIGQLTVTPGSALSVEGGILTVTGTTKLDGHLEVKLDGSAALQGAVDGSQGSLLVGSGRTVLLDGAASVGSVELAADATLGGAGSLVVGNSFSRAATAALGTSFSAVTLQQSDGDLLPGPLTVAGPISLSTGAGGNILIDRVVRATGGSGTITVEAGGALEVKAGESGSAGLVSAGNQSIRAASLHLEGSQATVGASVAQASIRSDGTQTITTTGGMVLRGGSQSGRAAVIVAPVQRITAGDSLTLEGGGGSASDARALIGGPQGQSTDPAVVDLQITVGKDLVMRASPGGVGARIGHEGGVTVNGSVRIEVAGNLSLEHASGAFEQARIGLPEATGGNLALKLIATGGNITLDGPVRGGGDVRVVAEKTGDPGLGKVTIGGSGELGSAGSGDALVVAAGGRFAYAGGGQALQAPNGRWLVYSRAHPVYHDRGGLAYGFKHYGQTYDPVNPYNGAGTGNGFLYSVTPEITPSVSGTVTRVYDGTVVASTSGLTASSTGAIDSDVVDVSVVSAGFADKNRGARKTIAAAVSIAGAVSDTGRPVYGYRLSGSGTVSMPEAGEITPRSLTPSFTGVDKTYDTGNAATVTASDDRIAGDVLTLGYDAVFSAPSVGLRSISVTNITLSPGGDAGNYTLTTTSASAQATIQPRPLTVIGLSAFDKTYDGTTIAPVGGVPTLLGGLGDVSLDASGLFGSFFDRRVGSNKPVGIGGLVLVGPGAGNYTLGSAIASASILARSLTVSGVSALDKVYDGTTVAALTSGSLSGVVAGDQVGLVAGAGSFADRNVGTGKSVTASFALDGADAGNYTLQGPGGLTASVTARPLTLSGLSAVDRVYDGTAVARIAGTPALQGAVLGDAVELDTARLAGSFSDRNVGSNKPVTISGLALTGSAAGNYTLSLNGAATTASITARALTVSGLSVTDRVYDGTSAASISGRPQLAGAVANDVVTLDASSLSGRFADRNVGSGKPVTVSGLSLSGADAGNYALTLDGLGLKASITARALTLSGLAAADKVYDRTIDAALAGVPRLEGGVTGDAVELDLSALRARFADRNVGQNKPVSFEGLALRGADAGNYTLSVPPPGMASITPRLLDAVDIRAADRVYDGTTVAALAGGSVRGVVEGDTVLLDLSVAQARFADRGAAVAKPVTVTGLRLSGLDASNYRLSDASPGVSATIGPRPLSPRFSAIDRPYDGTTDVRLEVADDRLEGDRFTIDYAAAFGDRHVGANKAVTISGIVLRGADASNYRAPADARATATVSVRPTATWTAAGSGDWMVAGNWDALPDRGNVADVSIPAGVQVAYDGSAPVTLASLTNAGALLLRAPGLDAARLDNQGRLIIGSGAAIDLAGRSVQGSGALVNQGTLALSASAIANPLENTGTLRLSGDNTLSSVANAGSAVQQDGTTTLSGAWTQTAGSTVLAAGSGAARLVASGGVRIEGGRLSGSGGIVGDLLVIDGVLAPGASPGAIGVAGSLVLGEGSVLDIELGGTTPGSFDRVSASGTVSLAGKLQISSIGGFVPKASDTFGFLSGARVSGRFADVTVTGAELAALNLRNMQVGTAQGVLSLPAAALIAEDALIAQTLLAGASLMQPGSSATVTASVVVSPSTAAASPTGAATSSPQLDGPSSSSGSPFFPPAGPEAGGSTGTGFDPTAPVAVRRTVLRTLDLPDSAPAESTTVAANREVTYTRSPSSTSAPAGGARRNGC